MAGFRIEGDTSGNVGEVDAGHNIKVTLPSSANLQYAGYVKLAGDISDSTDPAGLIVEELRVSSQGRLTVGEPIPLFNELFSASALNTAQFAQASTTQTITVGGGTLNLNASAINTLSTYCAVRTYQFFPNYMDFATFATWDASLSQVPQLNCTIQMGLFQSATNAAPIDGVYFEYNSNAELRAVINNNGVLYTSAALTAPSAGVMHKYKIVMENDRVAFYIDGACQTTIVPPTGLGFPTYTQAQPFNCRVIHGAVAPALANQLKIGYIFVGHQDAVGLNKLAQVVAAAAGRAGSQGQQGHTMGSTAVYTNSMAAGAGAALTNTTAAAGSGLGGQFAYLPTLAANTDGVLMSYLNPVATVAIPGKTLFITGIRIQSIISTTLTGGPLYMVYSLAYGHTAVSMATAEGAGTKAPRRVPLGIETFAAAATLGTLGTPNTGVYMPFNSPIAIQPGEYVAVCAKNLGGTVTTAGVVTAIISVDSYWE